MKETAMTRNPAEPDEPEPEGGRAAERLRDHMMGRFPAGTFPAPEDEGSGDDEAPEDAASEQETDTKKD
jgi:predicted RNase H-like nuclease